MKEGGRWGPCRTTANIGFKLKREDSDEQRDGKCVWLRDRIQKTEGM